MRHRFYSDSLHRDNVIMEPFIIMDVVKVSLRSLAIWKESPVSTLCRGEVRGDFQ